ncbi:MAG: hypothetical protein B6D44_02110 [Ignavibacteriales bacterium UTCHB2]|jgi:glycosyltransferase involved in cell wall biosynthesis|nr:MAG: hypothetical protein B6D44_02110 [Ignavibacteriales bacterium UTCHB2]HQI41285.1 glycosyltransferase [Ignavibacteriaceae bacterium]
MVIDKLKPLSEDELIRDWKGYQKIPLVSVTCISYNHERYIADALDGIFAQKTNFPFEVIVHDDASTDKTQYIIKKYAEKYPRVLVPILQKENYWLGKGINATTTIVWPSAKGKYIAWIEGDDYWIDPLKLQKQVDFLEANEEYSLCFHNANVIYDDNNGSRIFYNLETREYTGKEILKEWKIPTASVVFRRSMYNPVYHPDFIYGDIVLLISLATKGKLWGMNEVMSVYRRHKEGLTKTSKSNLFEYKKLYIKHITAIKESFNGNYEETCNEILAERYIDLSLFQLKEGNRSFLKSLKTGFKFKPDLFLKHFILNYLNIKKLLRRNTN